jgi:hypothetical protein
MNALALALLLAPLPTLAPGAAPGSAEARAQALFEEARTLLERGAVGAACEALAESQQLDARVGTALNLAQCEERRGRLLAAARAWQAAKALATETRDGRARVAAERAAQLEDRIPKLVVTPLPSAPASTTLTLHDESGAKTSLARAQPTPLDPGSYRLDVAARGHAVKTYRVELREGERARLEVTAGARIPERPAPVTTETESSWTPWHTAGVVVGAVGVSGLVAGGVLGAVAIGKKSASDDHCDETGCDGEGLELRSDGLAAAHASTGLFIAGSVLVGAALVVFVTDPPWAAEDAPSASPAARPPATLRGRLLLGPAGLAARADW